MTIVYRMRRQPEYRAEMREVVRVLNDLPHLLVRIDVSGGHFPHRAAHPFVMIQQGENEYFKDLFTEISSDNQTLVGYLPVNLPQRGTIVFGYGDTIWGTVPGDFDEETVSRLDRKRLPEKLVIVTDDFPGRTPPIE